MKLLEPEVMRYSRQLLLRGWNADTQRQLLRTSVAIPASLPSAVLYLIGAGIRRLQILPSHTSDTSFSEQSLTDHARFLDPKVALCFAQMRFEQWPDAMILYLSSKKKLPPDLKASVTLIILEDERRLYSSDSSSTLREEIHFPQSRLPLDLLAGTAAAMILLEKIRSSSN